MTGRLGKKLTAIREAFAGQAPPEAARIMHDTTAALVASGQAGRALGVGGRLPDLELPDAVGQLVSSRAALAKGPLILSFFRGHW